MQREVWLIRIPESFIFCRIYYYILYTVLNIYYNYYKNVK
mgnify:FL=1